VYCIYNEVGQTANNLLASLLEQLCRQQGSNFQEVEELHALHVQHTTRPSVPELSRLLQNQVRRFGKVFIVIDALDECPEIDRTRDVFLGEIRKLPSNIHILVTSRPNTVIEQAFAGASRLEIYAHDNDVRRHVVARLETQSLLARHVAADPSLQDAIISKILEKSQGM
jgi:archaellum biogenesis ATPase FlaH